MRVYVLLEFVADRVGLVACKICPVVEILD